MHKLDYQQPKGVKMIKFTKIIGAQVLSAYNCEYIGTVINMQTNKQNTHIKHLIISSADDETTYLLPANRIFSISDAVIIRNRTALSVTSDISVFSPINSTAFSITGINLGKICEITLDKKMRITTFDTPTHELAPKSLIFCNNGIALFNDGEKKYTNGCFSPKLGGVPPASDNTLVQALDEQNNGVSTPRTITARLPRNFRLP